MDPRLAVGSRVFVEKMKEGLGFMVKGRKIVSADDIIELREVVAPYGKAKYLDSLNTFNWNQDHNP